MKALRFGGLAVAILCAVLGCSKAPGVPPQTYEVRGVVRQLPAADQPSKEILIHHEAIPSFGNMNGETVGMEAMTMPFPVVDPALCEGFALGDKVTFRFQVDWEGSPPLQLTHLEKLTADTVLSFEE